MAAGVCNCCSSCAVLALVKAAASSNTTVAQRSGVVSDRIGPHRHAERRAGALVVVGADHHRADLRQQPLNRMQRQREAQVVLQALVDPAHPVAAATAEHHADDVFGGDHWMFN